MLKKLTVFVVTLMGAMLLCTGVQAASFEGGTFDDFSYTQSEGCTTVLTDLTGREYTHPGVLQPASLEAHTAVSKLAAYAIYRGEELVLSVQLHDIVPTNGPKQNSGMTGTKTTNGYYSVELPVSGGYTAFLTGLSPAYLQEMETTALDAIISQNSLRLEDLSFIDAEKQYWIEPEEPTTDTDQNLCWAASTANILHYTGWAEQAGFASADYMFEELISEFDDDGGRCEFGLQWFFNGYNFMQYASNWAHDVSGYADFKGYLPDYCYDTLVESIKLNAAPEKMQDVLQGLKAGYGAEISLGWYNNSQRYSGHSTTLWGLVYQTGSDLSQKESWKAIIIADSDNDVTYGDNRRTAPNTLTLYQITPICVAGNDTWYRNDRHTNYSDGILEDVTLLRPYSDTLPKDIGGTHTLKSSVDLKIKYVEINSYERMISATNFSKDENVMVYPSFVNAGGMTLYNTVIPYRVTVTDSNGESVFSAEKESNAATLETNWYTNAVEIPNWIMIGKLSPGKYTVRIEIDPNETIAEAYKINNVYETEIFVVAKAVDAGTFAFTVSPDYSRGNDDARLYLNCSGAFAYGMKQYVVQLNYWNGTAYEGYRTVYRGKNLPEYVKLDAYGSFVYAKIRAIPADETDFETVVDNTQGVSLPYYSLDLKASEKTFTPVTEGATSFAAGESANISIVNKSTYFDETMQYWVNLCAYDLANNCWYANGDPIWSDFYNFQSATNEISISSWSSNVGLPAGKYEIYAYLYYPVVGGYYQNRDSAYLGMLTVYADSYKNLTVQGPVGTVTDAEIGYNFLTPSGAFVVQVDYESEKEIGCYTLPRAAWDSGIVTGSIVLDDLEPNTEYTYTVSVYDGADTQLTSPVLTSSEGSFTTDAAATPDDPGEPVTPDYTLLAPGETSENMTYGGEVYYESYLPGEDGTWDFTFSGPDGYVQVLNEETGKWGNPVYFTTGGKAVSVAVKKGEPVHLKVFAYVSGTYTMEAPMIEFAYEYDDGCLSLNIVDADTQRCFVAAYTESGQMLVMTEIKTNGYHTVFPNDARIAKLRIFRIDKQTNAPIAPAVEIPIGNA